MPLIHEWDVSSDFQRQTAELLATKNKVIVVKSDRGEFFLKNCKRIEIINNVILYTPHYIIPFKRFEFIQNINIQIIYILLVTKELILKKFDISKLLIWYFQPKFIHFQTYLLRVIPSLYDCVDDVSWNIHPQKNIASSKEEKKCILSSKYFFVNSATLYKKKSSIRKPNALLPQGFDLKQFESVKLKNARTDKKIIGYIGYISYRINWKLLAAIALSLPHYEFHMYGPLEVETGNEFVNTNKAVALLKKIPNVHFFINKYSRSEIAQIINSFSIACIPYDLRLEANKFCFPMKFLEYIYWNKPIISTKIRELELYPQYVLCSNESNDWIKEIISILEKNKKYKPGRNTSIDHSWKNKIEKISENIN